MSFIHCSKEHRQQGYLARPISGLWDFIMLFPLYLLPFSLFFSFILLPFFIVSFYSRCSHAQVFGTALAPELGIPCRGAGCYTCLFAGQSVLDCAEAFTMKVKLYDYYYCNYVIAVYFWYVIFTSISITVSNSSCSIRVDDRK